MSRHPQRASPVLRGECTDLCRPGRVTGDAGQGSDERGSTHAVGVRCRRPTRSSGFSVVGGRRPKDGGHPPRTSARCQVLGSVQLGAECSLLLLEKPSRQRDRLGDAALLVEAIDLFAEFFRVVFFSRADRGTPEHEEARRYRETTGERPATRAIHPDRNSHVLATSTSHSPRPRPSSCDPAAKGRPRWENSRIRVRPVTGRQLTGPLLIGRRENAASTSHPP